MAKVRNAFSRILVLIVAVMCVLQSSACSCGRKDLYNSALKVGVNEIPKTLMPYASTSSSNIYAVSNIYNTMLSNHLVPKGYEEGKDYYFPSGEKYQPLDKDENYYMFEDGLFEKEGAYPRKAGSKYGYILFTPTEEEYQKQLDYKNIVKNQDEIGDPIEETQEEFIERRERVVPKDNWIEFRFKPRKGYTWNDGVPFTANDVEFTFKYVLKNRGALASIAFFLTNYFDCYVEDGDFILKLATNKISDIKTITTAIMILPRHIWIDIKKPAEQKNINPVGTGPYKVKKGGFIEDTSLALELREDYDKDLLKEEFYYEPLKEIFLKRISNQDVMLNAMQKGDIDVCLDGIGTQTTNIIKNSNKYTKVKISSSPSVFVCTLAFNMGKNGVFNPEKMPDSLKIREALSLCIDQDKIIDVVLSGNGVKVGDGLVQSYYPHALTDENGNYVYHETDVEKANKILDDLGYKKNEQGKRNLKFSVYGPKGDEVLVNYIGQLFMDGIGVELTFDLAGTDYAEKTKQRNNPDFDIVINSVNFELDKLLMFDARFGVYPNGAVRTWNVTATKNQELSRLMWEMDTEMDIFKQYEKSKAVQKKLASLYAEIPLYNGYVHSIYTDQRFSGWIEAKTGDILNHYSMKYLKKNK